MNTMAFRELCEYLQGIIESEVRFGNPCLTLNLVSEVRVVFGGLCP